MLKKTMLVLTMFIATSTFAETDLYVRGSGTLYPIALPQICLKKGNSEASRVIPKVITRNLTLSGFFEILNPNSFIETPGKCEKPDQLAYSDWSVIGAEGLVKGEIEATGSELKVRLFLHDVQRRKVVLGKEYSGNEGQINLIAHKFANEVMKFFTGESGVFGSKIVYSSKVGRFKELFVMDMDGSNIRQLTNDRGLAIAAGWSSDGERLVYTSYRRRVPDLFMLNVFNKGIQQITNDSSLELGAELSKGGTQILSARTIGKRSDIVLYNLDGSISRQLTKSYGVIDVSPDWSPDQSKIVFCSNRAGGPQIYTMRADGKGVKRISFVNSSYCTSPAWSPLGDRIAFVCRADRGYQLFTSRPDGSDALQLTSYGNNEDPSWAPNGKYLVFATTFGKGPGFHLALMRSDGSNMQQLTFGRNSDTQPNWGPLP